MYSRLEFNPARCCSLFHEFKSTGEEHFSSRENSAVASAVHNSCLVVLRLFPSALVVTSFIIPSGGICTTDRILYSHATFVIGWIDVKLVFTASWKKKSKNFFNCGSAWALLAVRLFRNWIARFQLISSSWIRNNELIRGGFEMVKSARSVRDWD